jgi:hypothetical protein
VDGALAECQFRITLIGDGRVSGITEMTNSFPSGRGSYGRPPTSAVEGTRVWKSSVGVPAPIFDPEAVIETAITRPSEVI